MAASGDRPKSDVLREIGFGGDPADAEVVLEAAGLSNPRKTNISAAKVDAVREALRAVFRFVCTRGDCQQAARHSDDGRQIVPASLPTACEVCGGSVNDKAIRDLLAACERRGWRRLCVVGGSPNARTELERLVGGKLQLRLVDGTMSRTAKAARGDIDWSDRVVIWGSTQLAHKVSTLYSGPTVITVARRGIAELASELVRSAELA